LRQAQASILGDLISKITRAKWTGGMTQAVACLLCKGSNPSSTKKKKKKDEKEK
jgi:hypothetical protein